MTMKGRSRELRAGRYRKGIAVIGAGNWGTSLATAAAISGVPLTEVVVRQVRGRRRTLAGLSVRTFAEAVLDAEVLWLCVPDGEIAPVAERIARHRGDLRGQTIVHSSGALTVEALHSVKQLGAAVGAIAPIFSFPTRTPVALDGIMFAVETAADERPATGRKLASLVRQLGGRPIRMSSENKVFYHAAATMASPLLVSALHAATTAAKLSGLSEREAMAVAGGLATTTMKNFLTEGSGRSFSGAFARGDAATVELHLQALLPHPMLRDVYLALARHAVTTLPVRNRAALNRILRDAEAG